MPAQPPPPVRRVTSPPPEVVSRFGSLLRKARAGDQRAWDVLYRWLAPQLLGYLSSGPLDDPEDVLGQVFLDVARRIGEFKGGHEGFRAWVFTIARARRVDEIRRWARRREEHLDTAEHELIAAPTDVAEDVVAEVAGSEILGLLAELTDDQAEVLALRFVSGLTAAEVAEVTGRSTGAVEQLQHRAVRSLRRALATRKESTLLDDYLT